MNEIMKLKKNYSCPSSKEICKVIKQHTSATDSFIRESETRLAEDLEKIEHLSHQLSISKDKLDIEKKVVEEKAKELRTENEKLKDLQAERNRIVKNNYDLERKCHKLRIIKPNTRDQFILELGQKKFNLYKQLTRIRWDYGALKEATKGFVTDKKSYIHVFCFPKDIQDKELSDLLWKEIELSTEKKFHDAENKENSSSNTDNYHSSLPGTKQIDLS